MVFKRKKILAIGVIILVCFVGLIIFQKTAKTLFLAVSSPLSRIFWQVGEESTGFLNGLFNFQEIRLENAELAAQNLALKKQVKDLAITKAENQELRKALEVNLSQEFSLELVKVIAKEPLLDAILIKTEGQERLAEGMAVVTSENVLVGAVSWVSAGFAQVKLITEKGFSFDIELGDNILALSEGEGGLKLGFRDAQRESKIEQGYIASTANLSGKFPKGLLVGEVSKINQSAAEPFQSGSLVPYFTKQSLNTLFVITNFAVFDFNN